MRSPPIIHLTALAARGAPSICRFDSARWLWSALRRSFPSAAGVALMPDHLHLVTPARDGHRTLNTLRTILGHHSRHFGSGEGLWRCIGRPEPVHNRRILARTVRYVVLNASRGGHCQDPLGWLWSTHRDVMGAVADPWVTAHRLADLLGWPLRSFQDQWHAAVSTDSQSGLRGTPPPRPAPRSHTPRIPIDQVTRAAAAATRATPEDVRRHGPARTLFVQLARSQGWTDRRVLMREVGASLSTIKRLAAATSDPVAPRAGLVCLGVSRLR